MPHLVILYTANLDRPIANGGADLGRLCRKLADAMLDRRDELGQRVFPTGGTRVLAYPATHAAVADGGAAGRAAGGDGDYGFVYLNLRMGRGRSDITHRSVGEALLATTMDHIQHLLKERHTGITLQIDEGPEVFDAKRSSLHPLFAT